MQLLNLFHSGLLGPAVVLIGLTALVAFGFQIRKGVKAGVPVFSNGFTYFFIVTLILWIVALVSIASDYKGI